MATAIDKAVEWAVKIADDNSHGYDQGNREGPNYDCSSLVINAWKYAGVHVEKNGATTTHDMYNAFIKSGFKDVTKSINLSTGKGLKKGDVLLNVNHHTVIAISETQVVNASQNEFGGITGGKSGDQTGKEIYVRSYYLYPNGGWNYVLRYPGGSTTGSITVKSGSNLKTWSDIITAEKLESNFSGVLKGLGNLFIKYSIVYQVNPALAAAIALLESGRGTSPAAKNQKNLFGQMTADGMSIATFKSYEQCIKTCISNISRNYLYKGLRTVQAIKNKYSPDGAANDPNGTNRNWARDVTSIYKELTGREPSDLGTGVKDEDEASRNMEQIQEGGGATATGQESSTQVDITSQKNVGVYGAQMQARQNDFRGRKNTAAETPEVELYIIDWGGKIYSPIIAGAIEWETNYSGTPAQLSFTVVKDENIGFYEGSQVIFKYQGAPIFYGFIFKKSRDKEHHIKCTCYDQTRYLQNKNSMVYSNKTATEVIQMIAKDFSLNVGNLVDTGVEIPLRVEDNTSLFDIIQYALDYTTNKTGTWYTFYDDFGKLTLIKSVDMKSNCIITKDNAENFDYTSSINESTYTRVRHYYDNKETGVREVYTYDESAKRPYYGVLQLCEKIDDNNIEAFRANAEAQMKRELADYSAPTRSLEIKGVFGDVMVRGGSLVHVSLDLGDIIVNSQLSGNYFVCDSVKHHFEFGRHTMDVNLTGGGYRFI